MSLEDLDSNFQSDESDYEDEEENNEKKTTDEDYLSNYLELVHIHYDLMTFEHIYNNNEIIDSQIMENEAGLSFDFDSVDSELGLSQDEIHSVCEDLFSTPHEARPSLNIDALGSELALLQDQVSSGSSTVADIQQRVSSIFEDLFPTNSSVAPHEDGSSSDTDSPDLSLFQDHVQLYEEVISAFSSASSSSSDSDAENQQMINADDTNNAPDEAAESQL